MAKITSLPQKSVRTAYEVIDEITGGINKLRAFKDIQKPRDSSSFVLPFYMSGNDEMCDSECENCAKIFGRPQQQDDRRTPADSVEVGFSKTASNSNISEHNFDGIDSDKSIDHLSTASDINITCNNIFDEHLETGKKEICDVKRSGSAISKAKLCEPLVQCSHCDFSCLEQNDLIIHCKTVHDDLSQFDCFACEEQFMVHQEMINHLENVHQKNDKILCKICNMWVKYQFIPSHYKTCKATKPYRCVYCVKYFGTYEDKKKHQAKHNKKCPYCESSFLLQSDYRKHVRTVHHKEVIEDFINFVDCELDEDVMDTSLYNTKTRFKHLLTSPSNECAASASEDEDIQDCLENQTHKDVKHKSNTIAIVHVPLTTIKEILNSIQRCCPDCYRKFMTHNHLVKHCKTRHHLSQPYECYSCHVRFTSANQRTHHLYTEHNSIYYILCKLCDKYVKTEYKMSRHVVDCFQHLKESKIYNNNKMTSKDLLATIRYTKDGKHLYLRKLQQNLRSEKKNYSIIRKKNEHALRYQKKAVAAVHRRNESTGLSAGDTLSTFQNASSLTSISNLRHSERPHEGGKKIKDKNLKNIKLDQLESKLKNSIEQQRRRTVIDSETQVNNNMEQIDKASPLLVPMQNLDNVLPSDASSLEIEAANKSCDHRRNESTGLSAADTLSTFQNASSLTSISNFRHSERPHEGGKKIKDKNLKNMKLDQLESKLKNSIEQQRRRTVIDSETQVNNNVEQIVKASPLLVPMQNLDNVLLSDASSLEIEAANKSCEQTGKSVINQNFEEEYVNVMQKSPDRNKSLVNNQKKNVPCSFCTKSFQSKYDMLEHLNEAHKKIETILCKLCGISVSSDLNIVNHLVECISTHQKEDDENRSDKRECTLCDRFFNNYTDLLEHVKNSHGTYVCYTCDARFYTTEKRQYHLIEKHGGLDKIICKLCRRPKDSETKIKEHMDACKDKPYQCRYCYARFFNGSFYLAHSEKHKHAFFQQSVTPISDTCSIEYSKESFSSESYVPESMNVLHKSPSKDRLRSVNDKKGHQAALLEYSENVHSTPYPYVCYTCNQQFEGPVDRLCHIQQKHYMPNGFVCKMCGTIEKNEQGIKCHMLLCAKKPCHCKCCSFRFYTHFELAQHHDEVAVKPHQCQCCLSRFGTYDELKVHEIMHIRPLDEMAVEFELKVEPTEIIGGVDSSSTNDLSSLEYQQIENIMYKNHDTAPVQTIEEDQTILRSTPYLYVCYTCEEKFEDPISRLTHILQKHYKPNGFVCKVCSIIKDTEQELKNHMLICSVKHLQCKCCSLRFCTQEGLTEHQNEVATKTYLCQYCPCRFATEDELKIHEILHTNSMEQLRNVLKIKQEPTSQDLLLGECNIDISNNQIENRTSNNNRTEPHNLAYIKSMVSKIGEKWCPDCYKVFFKYNNLKLHCKKEHNNSNPRGCYCCSARFKNKKEQIYHLKTAHATGKYPCKFCNTQLEAAKLLEHIIFCKQRRTRRNEVSSDNKPSTIEIFTCSSCQEEFKSWYRLDLHEVVDHGKNSKNEETVIRRSNDAGNNDVFSVQEESLERPCRVAAAAPMESDDFSPNRFSQIECDGDNDIESDGKDVDMIEHSEEDQQAQDLFTNTCSPTDGNISFKATRDHLKEVQFGYKEWVVVLHDFIKSSTSEDIIDDDIDSHSMDIDISNTQLSDDDTQLPSINEVGEFTEPITHNADGEPDHDLKCDASTTNMDSDSDDSLLPLSYIKAKLTMKTATSNCEGFENGNGMDCDKTNTDAPSDVNSVNIVSEQVDEFMNEELIAKNEKLELNILVSNIIERLQDETDDIDDSNMDVQMLPATLTDKDMNGPDYNVISDPLFIEGDNTSFSLAAVMPKEKRTSPDQYLDECWVVLCDFLKSGHLTEDESN